jgi:hypothetical protein
MSFLNDFFGNTQADDIEKANATSNSWLDRGLGQFQNVTKDYLGQAMGQFDTLKPYSAAGTDTLGLLRNALGLNGEAGSKSFFDNLQNSAGYQDANDAGIRALDASAAARGSIHSGGQNRDLFTYGGQFFNNFANNRISQLMGLFTPTSGIDSGVAGSKAGLLSGAGSDLANAEFGTNQLKANSATSMGNALAQSRSTGINNLLGVGNMAASFFKPAPTYNFGTK